MNRSLTGKEVRYILHTERVNLRWLSEKLGISPQSLNSRLNASEFRQSYLVEINNVLGRDIFGVDVPTMSVTGRQPILDIRVGAAIGIPLESEENKVVEYVTIPSLTNCIGIAIYGESMKPDYRAGDIIFVRNVPVEQIEYGHASVIVTVADRLIRNVYPSDNDGCIRLSASNADRNGHGTPVFPDFDIKKDMVLYLYKVVGCLRREQL